MFFHLRVFLHSVFFFLLLKLVISETVSGFLVKWVFESPLLLFISMMSFVIAISMSVLRIGKKWSVLPIPVLLAVSSVGLVAFIDSSSQKFFFILLSAAIYYFCLLGIYRLNSYFKDKTARSILASSGVAAVFFFYSAVYGSYLNFTIPLWSVMSAFFLASFLVSMQYFRLMEKNKKRALLFSLVMGLSMTEIAWVLSFWPFGYLTTGVIMLIFYYVIWDLACTYFGQNLSKRRMVANMTFFGILVSVVLLSSRWLPVV